MGRMKHCCLLYAAVSAMAAVISCERAGTDGDQAPGYLKISFPEEFYRAATASSELPDTNDFILDIRDRDGEVVYSGPYGNSPETVTVPPGSCDVSIRSSDFGKPQFSMPQYGDDQCVMVPSDGIVNVRLQCRQINSGIRLRISPDFLSAYPYGVLFVSSGQGRLMYGYSEKRIAYFLPGSVSVILNNEGKDQVLMTRTLSAQEILTVGIYVSDKGTSQERAITVSVDTSRIWNEESYVIGGSGNDRGDIPENALSVMQAKASAGEKDVWVCGYIAGGDLTRSSISFTPPFTSSTNLAIASRASADSKESCLSVSLPAGDIRDALNLVDHPENLGRRVYLNGDLVESYFGLTGIKNVSDFILK